MRSILVPFLLLTSLAPLAAQRSLADVQRQFLAESKKLAATSPTHTQRDELLAQHIGQLQKFVASEAQGMDRWNGRLMLADLQLARSDRAGAAATLRTIDAKEAPALLLVTAAAMAQHLDLRPQRDAWIDAAVGKEAPLPDRLAMGRLLMTVLHEVKRGEALFDAALAAAGDDEQKAFVRWHHADALRDREDLPENAGFDKLERLAEELPKTYWGGVAKDRLKATRLQRGDEAIAFQGKTRTGADVSLAALAGKAVVLAFWSASDMDTPALVDALHALQKQHGDRLAVLGVCLDRDDAAIGTAVKELGIQFPVVGDGKGIETDVALRWFVEGPAVHVVDARGKVAGLGLHVGTSDARAELSEVVERACQR